MAEADLINKKINFQFSKISVKIIKKINNNTNAKVYLCSDINNPSITYCLKVASATKEDKFATNAINTEIVTLVNKIK